MPLHVCERLVGRVTRNVRGEREGDFIVLGTEMTETGMKMKQRQRRTCKSRYIKQKYWSATKMKLLRRKGKFRWDKTKIKRGFVGDIGTS